MENNYILTSDGELYHWGVKGMKWGVRRYQNKDGSLKPAGKKRRRQQEDEHEDYKKAHDNKSVKNMSDAELRARNNRLQMEAQYSKLTEKKISAGRKFVTGVVVGAATSIATGYAVKYGQKGAEYLGGKVAKAIKKRISIGEISL